MAGYVDFRQHLYRWLTLDLGVRIDHHSHVGDRMGSSGWIVVPLACECRDKTDGRERFPLSDDPGALYVSAGQSRFETGATVEL